MKTKYLFLLSFIVFPVEITIFNIAIIFGVDLGYELSKEDNSLLMVWLFMPIFAFFIIWIRALVDAYPKNKFNFLLLLFLSGFYHWFYYFKYYDKQLDNNRKPLNNISKYLKQAFILSLPILIIGGLELFGIDVHDFIAVLSMIFLIFPTFYLWYYMLVDIFEKNKLHFVFMYLCFPYIWIYYIFFYEKGFNLINKIKNKKRYKR
ncbi:hypothetical protein [bacterium endosymbiont of Bathymodiolus sp. 5 South]|jgi:hypothetical protein|uniref:hypothetical protein n=1 Tax=bacterium endosymbiont of Bathymodiolus sp. 5 South TaxID=1181670 RepID=UPI00111A13B3|nr:hypothetical protein [bacterium endosymbiont of Bathymodiolus sp. 5 South]VVH61338.1 hypothetical protein BSPWISOX_2707 [uncultured Gammaproteobacteria bacterium]VVM17761.1 hypothetical protein BSPWISOXPB_722 [uncultured Gammaproteobacteria bacterium]